jgi:hypothetical protein
MSAFPRIATKLRTSLVVRFVPIAAFGKNEPAFFPNRKRNAGGEPVLTTRNRVG